MLSIITIVLASAVATAVKSVIVPVVVAALTAAATLVLTRASEAANRPPRPLRPGVRDARRLDRVSVPGATPDQR